MLDSRLDLFKSGIGRRLITYMVLFSSFITLLITAIQLFLDYQDDVYLIEDQFQQIQEVNLRSLTSSLWTSDTSVLETHLNGISHLRDMQFLEIRDKEKVWVSLGTRQSHDVMSRQYPMIISHRGRDIEIGTLTVVASLTNVYQRLIDKVWLILVGNGIKTFLVGGFMLIIFYLLSTRHLIRIADFARSLDTSRLDRQLRLQRKNRGKQKTDELDQVVDAFNHMQANIKESFSALRQSEERFSVLARVAPVGIFRTDAQGHYLYVNKCWTELAGLSEAQAMGEGWSQALHPEDRERISTQWSQAVAENIPFKSECRFQRPDGNVSWLLAQSEEEYDAAGRVVGFVGTITDITDRKTAEVELKKYHEHLEELVQERTIDMKLARDEAERASAAKSDFLSHMSHELRTPMNAILGFGQLLQLDERGFNEAQRDNISQILDAGQHLMLLINELLDLARIESGKLDISMEEVSVDEVLQKCLALIALQAESRQMELLDQISGKGYCVQADFTRLNQVLVNLLTNAVKYNHEHGRITLDGEIIGKQHLRISITDTGAGLTEEEIAKLFTSFERLNTVHNVEGTGIGLIITKHLIELMDGTIGVESTPGEGSTFWVELELS
ncbi:MAG: hypothetical protein BMS9Abin26_0611 [Gammaproteobacteria bacterium]|nr:MAG: hypothetical protein BMS9Abin26_0611 [Gammaproteobacteria bacterium]